MAARPLFFGALLSLSALASATWDFRSLQPRAAWSNGSVTGRPDSLLSLRSVPPGVEAVEISLVKTGSGEKANGFFLRFGEDRNGFFALLPKGGRLLVSNEGPTAKPETFSAPSPEAAFLLRFEKKGDGYAASLDKTTGSFFYRPPDAFSKLTLVIPSWVAVRGVKLLGKDGKTLFADDFTRPSWSSGEGEKKGGAGVVDMRNEGKGLF